jgi:hypothetical protein
LILGVDDGGPELRRFGLEFEELAAMTGLNAESVLRRTAWRKAFCAIAWKFPPRDRSR